MRTAPKGAANALPKLERRNSESFPVRRETGNEWSVQVRYDEGVANHIGLEPSAVAREGGGEASVEEHTGQPLSLKDSYSGCRRRCECGRQHVWARASERPDNVIERLPKPLHASVRRALRQAWELDDADKAERLLRNLARRLDQEAPGVAASILEGLDEMLTVNRLGLPAKLRRSLACTNSIENMMGTLRRVCRNVKRWRNAAMGVALDPPPA
jgi:hypothetical protein